MTSASSSSASAPASVAASVPTDTRKVWPDEWRRKFVVGSS